MLYPRPAGQVLQPFPGGRAGALHPVRAALQEARFGVDALESPD
jgi:hypothetical protein